MRKTMYNLLKIPYWEAWVLDRGLLVTKVVRRKRGQEYITWKENGFILPRLGENPFSVQAGFGSLVYYQLENALYLKEYKIPEDVKKQIEYNERQFGQVTENIAELNILFTKGTKKMSKEAEKETSKLIKKQEKLENEINKLRDENSFNKEMPFKDTKDLITSLNPNLLKQMYEEKTTADIMATEKSWWEELKIPVMIGIIGILLIYFIQIMGKL